MTPLYLVTLGGVTFSGREAAIIAAVVVVLAILAWLVAARLRRR